MCGQVQGADHLNGAGVFLNDAPRQCQTQSGSLAGFFGGEKGFKHFFLYCLGDTVSLIFNVYGDFVSVDRGAGTDDAGIAGVTTL